MSCARAPLYDVVIVDEAHHGAQRTTGTKRLVVLVRKSADGALLLLTATPHACEPRSLLRGVPASVKFSTKNLTMGTYSSSPEAAKPWMCGPPGKRAIASLQLRGALSQKQQNGA